MVWLVTFEDGRTMRAAANPGLGPSGDGLIVATSHVPDESEITRLTAELTALRTKLETVEAETIERAVKRIKADKDIQGLVKARIFTALRNLEPRHD